MNNKTITVNPDLFRFTNGGKTRKKRESRGPEIKVKSPREKVKTLRKNHILRHIREQQNKNYKELIDSKPTTVKSQNTAPIVNEFNNSFDESLKYMQALSEKTEQMRNHNHTLKSYTPAQSLLYHPNIDPTTQTILPNFVQDSIPVQTPIHLEKPKWGCLKNGQLPTYRNWINATQKQPIFTNQTQVCAPQVSAINVAESLPIINETNASTLAKPDTLPQLISSTPLISNSIDEKHKLNTSFKNQLYQMKQKMEHTTNKPTKSHYPKRQRTVRRTYKLGKSKNKPIVGVLISNKTMRANVTTKKQLLNQTNIDEVKRYLIKNGFIRVGTSAPNDVLRKMHETAMMMCGEIQNHNPDNLLYNFLNST
jgi:hypothetical protein